MSRAIENFIENYLLTRGYPLTDTKREQARDALAQHPDLEGSSPEERIALLDRRMWFGSPMW